MAKQPNKAPKRNRAKEKHPKTIEKIRATQLVNRLQDNALGRLEVYDPSTEKMVLTELTPGQIKSIEILLKKSLPDLSAQTLDAAEGTALVAPILNITKASGN